MRFLVRIGETKKTELLKQLRAGLTHDSTAIDAVPELVERGKLAEEGV